MMRITRFLSIFLSVLFLGLISTPAFAHVKWFSGFSFSDRPLQLSEAITPVFLGLVLLSMVVIGLLVILDRRLSDTPWYRSINTRLSGYRDRSGYVIRIAAGAVLLLSWQADAMLVPELSITSPWIGWMQFLLAFLLLFSKTTSLAGLGLMVLYFIGISQFGLFYMLDYVLYAGAGYYLAVQYFNDNRIKGSGLPVLYATVGFSLCWVALEKIIYPQWGLYVLQQQPQLALGFDLDFFLIGAAFVEFSLGYLLIINLLQRPMSVVITLVFFLTTLVFGKLEIIGHTLIHGALIVFLIEGPGRRYKAPITFHDKLGLRTAFASVNFALLLVILLVPYSYGAWQKYERSVASESAQAQNRIDVSESGIPQPQVDLAIHRDSLEGYNLELITQNFSFVPVSSNGKHSPGEGHAHLFINGNKAARLYGRWYHLSDLPPGSYELTVLLTSIDHQIYTNKQKVISDTLYLDIN